MRFIRQADCFFPKDFARGLRCAVALVACALLAAPAAIASDRWLTSYEEALAKAQETGRPVLTIFTGSDWCPHCKTLEQNVLETPT